MNDARDPGPEAVDKILDGLEQFVDQPAEVARKARRLRAHIEALRAALSPFVEHVGKDGETVILTIGKDSWTGTLKTSDFTKAREVYFGR